MREDTALGGSEVIGEGRYHQGDSRLQTPVLSNPAAVSLIVCLYPISRVALCIHIAGKSNDEKIKGCEVCVN